jgi:hypothetical protein
MHHEIRLTAGVTGRQEMLAPLIHLFPSMVYPEVRVCLILRFVFPTGHLYSLIWSCDYYCARETTLDLLSAFNTQFESISWPTRPYWRLCVIFKWTMSPIGVTVSCKSPPHIRACIYLGSAFGHALTQVPALGHALTQGLNRCILFLLKNDFTSLRHQMTS